MRGSRTYECDMWEACYRFGVVGLPYGALAGGVLTGKYLDGTKYGDGGSKADPERPSTKSRMRVTPDFQPRYGMPMAMLATEKYVKLAEEYGVTPTELALAWAKQRPCNTSIIMGTTTVRQVEECVRAFKLELPAELMAKIDEVHDEFRNPSMFYCHKPYCMEAKWLGSAACPATKKWNSRGKMAPSTILAGVAALAALGFVALRR